MVFAAATLWINYQVKENIEADSSGGSVHQLGTLTVGDPAPEFATTDLAAHAVKLSDYQGRHVVLIDFWATWCGPCKMAMPGLQSLLDDFKPRGLEILSVNEGESAEQAGAYIAQKAYGFHVLLDPKNSIGATYGVRGIPTLLLVDQAGIIRWIRVGYAPDDSDLRRVIEKFLAR